MYVCICNALTERAIAAAVRDGASSAAQVYSRLDCAPQCGKCMTMVRDMINSRGWPDDPSRMAAE